MELVDVKKMHRPVVYLLAMALTAACGSDSVDAEDADRESLFEGETITLVVPVSPGGGFDSYARLVAPYLEEALGATVVVKNEPGAGGLLAINNLMTAEPDGSTIALMNGIGAAGASLAGAEGAQFSLDDLGYVGLFQEAGSMVVVGPESPYETIEELIASDSVKFGATGAGGDSFLGLTVFTNVFDMEAQIATGFEGSQEVGLALSSGDIEAMSSGYGSGLSSVLAGDHHALVALDDEPLPQLPDVPLVVDMDFPSDSARQIMDTHLQLLSFTRPVVTPPGISSERLAALRDALAIAAADPQLKKELEETGRELDYMDGEQTEALVADLLEAPAAYVDLMKETYRE
jgi:tripartite-type tricarboxylate transporter receptor subunit TctC